MSLKEPMGGNEQLNAEEKSSLVVEAIQAKKGHEIVTIDLSDVEHSICDRFIICHGESTTQVAAIADSIEKELKEKAGIRAHHVEGVQNSQWVLIDLFDVLVHVFLEEYRSFYKLEELWADGIVVRAKE